MPLLVWLHRNFTRADQSAFEPQVWYGPPFAGTEGHRVFRRIEITDQEAAEGPHRLEIKYPATSA